jgi:hypothetical protein
VHFAEMRRPIQLIYLLLSYSVAIQEVVHTVMIKKPGLDPKAVKLCRSTSKLSILSKVMQRLAARRLTD